MTSLLDNPMRESLQAGRMAGSAAQASLAQLLARSALGPVLLCLRAGTGHACALLAQDAAISACSIGRFSAFSLSGRFRIRR